MKIFAKINIKGIPYIEQLSLLPIKGDCWYINLKKKPSYIDLGMCALEIKGFKPYNITLQTNVGWMINGVFQSFFEDPTEDTGIQTVEYTQYIRGVKIDTYYVIKNWKI